MRSLGGWCLKLPLSGSKIRGIPEVIEDSSNGPLFESGNAMGLAHALDCLARERILGQRGGHMLVTYTLWITMWIGYLQSTGSC